MNWFENWFDSKYYHILYKSRDNKEAELFINNLVSYLRLKKDSKIIDVGCGKGRHATYLSFLGFNVTGIDLSKNTALTTLDLRDNQLTSIDLTNNEYMFYLLIDPNVNCAGKGCP